MGERLVTTGTIESSVTLTARGRPIEFCVVSQAPRFEAVVALGFDVGDMKLIGLCVERFQGNVNAAIEFARALEREVRTIPKRGTPSASTPRLN